MYLSTNGVHPTPENFAQAEDILLDSINGDAALWAGRAGTALYYAYHMAAAQHPDIDQPEIIMPAMMCATAANVAHVAGMTPRFADVDEAGLVTLKSLQTRMTENTVAVVVIHLLGNTVNMASIAAWCRVHDVLLIEDPTQALSATLPDGSTAGSYGDVTVYSFNRTKIISEGNGVLVTRTPERAAQLRETIAQLPPTPVPDKTLNQQLALSYRNLHHALVGLLRVRALPVESIASAFMSVRASYEGLFLRLADTSVDLNTAFVKLPTALERRRQRAAIYTEQLADGPWRLLTGFQESGVCWRFSLLVDKPAQQVAFSEAVRKDGFHVSNLYWAVNQFFRPSDVCPQADVFGRRIVNLWVDDSVDETYVRACSASLLKHAHLLM